MHDPPSRLRKIFEMFCFSMSSTFKYVTPAGAGRVRGGDVHAAVGSLDDELLDPEGRAVLHQAGREVVLVTQLLTSLPTPAHAHTASTSRSIT